MGIFTYLGSLGRKKSVSDASGTWFEVGSVNQGVNERALLDANKEWVFIAVDKVAHATASVRFKVMQYRSNGDDQELFDGPLVDFLDKPGTNFTGKDFIYLNTIYKELTGNSFWEKQKGNKVNPLIPTKIKPIIEGGKLTGFEYTDGGAPRKLTYKDVLHDRYIDPAKPWWGVGKLAKIAKWVDVSVISSELLNTLFSNGGVFGGFIETEEESQERVNLIKAGLKNDHTGARNWFKWAILPKGAKANANAPKLSDLQMGETDDRYRDKILSAFGVPKSLVGIIEDVNRANAEANEYVFAKYTIKPIVDDLIAFLNVHIAPMLDPNGKTYFAYDDFIPENMENKLKEREIALKGQAYKTVNEIRAEEGLTPVPGGDVIYGNPMLLPLGTPQASPDAPVNDDDDEDTPPPAKARQRAIPAHVRHAAKAEERVETFADTLARKMAEFEEVRDVDADAHKAFVARVAAYMILVENAVRNFNSRQQSMVLQNLGAIMAKGFGKTKIAKTDLFDVRSEVQAMVDVAGPLLSGLLTEEAVREWEAQGFIGTFDSNSDIVRNVVGRATRRLAKSYNNTTANLLKSALIEAIDAGDSLEQITKRVQEVYAYSDIVRAKAVANTETFYIANKANQLAYQQSGVVKTMRWYTAEDERVCEFCGPMHGKVIDVSSTFFKKGETMIGADGGTLALDYRAVDVAPLHTNCRCFIRPEEISIE
jgi:HK97 family phage portal protein